MSLKKYLYTKVEDTTEIQWERLKKNLCRQNTAGVNQMGRPNTKLCFFVCLFVFFFFSLSFLFVPRLVIRRMRKGMAGKGGGARRKERKKKKKKREKGEGGGKNL